MFVSKPHPTMKAHTMKLQKGFDTFLGKLVVTDGALYFLCASKGSGLLESAGVGVGGIVGGVMQALADDNNYGELPADVSEKDLPNIVSQLPGSMVFEPVKIELLKDTWLQKMIKVDGNKYFVTPGFSKELRAELTPWAVKHKVQTKGF